MLQAEQICCQKGVELRGRPTGKGSRSTAGGGEVYGRPASEGEGDQLQGRGELHVRSASERGGDQLQGRGGLHVRSASGRGGDQLQEGRGGLYVRSASERGGDQLQGRGELCVDPPAAGSKNCFVPASSQLPQSDWTVVKRLVVGREMHLWWTGGRKEMHLKKEKNEENREREKIGCPVA